MSFYRDPMTSPATPQAADAAHRFATATAVTRIDAASSSDARFAAIVHDGWDIGGNANGGYVLALAGRAMSEAVERTPLTITAHYLAPVPAGPVQIDVATVRLGRRMVRCTFDVVFTTDWLSSDVLTWDDSLENGTTHSFMLVVGDTVGQMFSAFIPAGKVVEQAQLTSIDGTIGHSVVVEPAAYTGDTGSTDPANALFRIAMG